MENQSIAGTKDKKIRNHKILLKPVIGPILGSIIAYILSEFIFGTIFTIILSIILNPSQDQQTTIMVWCAALGGVVTIFLYQLWFKGIFKGCYNGNWGNRQTKIMVLIMAAANLALIIWGYTSAGIQAVTITTIGSALMPGICEELGFRLVPISLAMHKAKDKKDIYMALTISTILFGLVHFSNVLIGQSLDGTIIQVIATLGMGFFFGAIYLRTGNLLITLIFHCVYDFLVLLQAVASGLTVDLGGQSLVNYIPQTLIVILYVVLGVLMIKGNEDQIIDVWNERWNRE